MPDALQTVVVNDQAFTVNDQGATAIALLKDSVKKLTDEAAEANKKLADTTATIETKDAEIATLKQSLEDAKVTPAQLRALQVARDGTMKAAKALGLTDADMDDKDEAEIKAAAVKKKMGDAAKGWSDEAINVSFATLTANQHTDAAPELAKELSDGAHRPKKTHGFSDAALKAAGVKLKKEG